MLRCAVWTTGTRTGIDALPDPGKRSNLADHWWARAHVGHDLTCGLESIQGRAGEEHTGGG